MSKAPHLLIGIFSLACGCGNPDQQSSAAGEILGAHHEGDFRGNNIGDAPQKVMKTEGSQLVYAMPDELVYRLPSGGADSVWYEISYNFREDGLYDIDLEVFSHDTVRLEELAADFTAHYIDQYGAPKTVALCDHWRVMTSNADIVDISVCKGEHKYGTRCIRVNFTESPQSSSR